jgi:hypothetical protein
LEVVSKENIVSRLIKKHFDSLLKWGFKIGISVGCGCVEHTSWAQRVEFCGKYGTSKSQQGAMEMNKGPKYQKWKPGEVKLLGLLYMARA